MTVRLGLTVLTVILFASGAEAFSGHSMKLGSGKTVEIIDFGPSQSAKGLPALILRYQTSIPVKDVISLRKEVDEIWDRLEVNVDKTGYQQAIISANEPVKGGLKNQDRTLNFVFEKIDGSWRTYEDHGQEKLDELFVKRFMDRLDWIYDYNEINAFLVYLGNGWKATFINLSEGTSSLQTVDRRTFVAAASKTSAATKKFHHQREILKVTIFEGGISAEVESREYEEAVINGKNTRVIEHTIDFLEIRDHVVTITRTIVTFEKNEMI